MTWTFVLVWILIAIFFLLSYLFKNRLKLVAALLRFIAIILLKITIVTIVLLLISLIIKSNFILFIIGIFLTIEIFLNF